MLTFQPFMQLLQGSRPSIGADDDGEASFISKAHGAVLALHISRRDTRLIATRRAWPRLKVMSVNEQAQFSCGLELLNRLENAVVAGGGIRIIIVAHDVSATLYLRQA